MRWIMILLYAFILKFEADFNRPGSLSLTSKSFNPLRYKLLERIQCSVITLSRKSNNLMKSLYRVSEKGKNSIFLNTKSTCYLFGNDMGEIVCIMPNILDMENINGWFIYSWQAKRSSDYHEVWEFVKMIYCFIFLPPFLSELWKQNK